MFLIEEFHHLKIQLEDVISATDNFGPSKLIGRGGFGRVYKGKLSLPEGQRKVAFKRLDRKYGQGNTEFWKEIMMLSKLKHVNLISLLHFCIEGDERILVYEYASRGSLDRYLSDASIPWIQRLSICVQVARAINYLHDPKESQQRVLHRDIKSSNILLDENWVAKLSDFGLSKIGLANQPQTYLISNAVGTIGYCDPMYYETGFLSKESDVYSFGVVLFEVICGKLCCEYRNNQLLRILVPTWKKSFVEKRLEDVIFQSLRAQIDEDCLKTFSTIAYRCLNRDHKERPVMDEIINKLEVAFTQQLTSVKNNSIRWLAKSKKREHGVHSSYPVKQQRLSKSDGEHIKEMIAKITFNGCLVDAEGVKKLIQLMQPKTAENKIDMASRIMLVNVISSTNRSECLDVFVQFLGLHVLDNWLNEFYEGKSTDKCGEEEFLFALLRALDRLPVNLNALQTCNIRKSVNHLRGHKNPAIQKEATSIVNKWNKGVEDEMTFIEAWSGPRDMNLLATQVNYRSLTSLIRHGSSEVGAKISIS